MNLNDIPNRCKRELPAFLEMLSSFKAMLQASAQDKPRLRYQVKLAMEKMPFLSGVGLAAMGLLFLLALILTIATKGGFFIFVTILLIMAILVACMVDILFAKPVDGMMAKADSSMATGDAAIGDAAISEQTETADVISSAAKENNDLPQTGNPVRGIAFYCAQVGIGLGIAVCSITVYCIVDKPGVLSGCILIGFICSAVSMIADNLVNIYTLAFFDKNQSIPATRMKVLQWFARSVVSLPLLFPIYGAAKGVYEVATSEHKGSQVSVNLVRYKLTCFDMNWFSRLGYRLAYHSLLDFKEGGAQDSLLSEGGHSGRETNDESDVDCVMEISTALLNDDYELARQWANRIKDDRQRRFQLAAILKAEKIYYSSLGWR